MKIIDQMPEEYLRQFGAGSISLAILETAVANHLAQSPMTNAGITQGIRRGLADCQIIWGHSSRFCFTAQACTLDNDAPFSDRHAG